MMFQRERLLYCGYPAGTDERILARIASFNIYIALYVLLSLSFGIVHLSMHHYLLASVLLTETVLICGVRAFVCATKKHEPAFVVAAILAILLLLAAYITGGIRNYGPLWFFVFPLAALVLLGPMKGSIASLAPIVAALLLQFQPFSRIMRTSYDPVFICIHTASYLVVFLLALSYELQKERAKKEIRELRGLLPICSSCKRIRDDQGYWNQIEDYIQKRSKAQFSHGLCSECMTRLYPDLK
jgi:hypothetical protein